MNRERKARRRKYKVILSMGQRAGLWESKTAPAGQTDGRVRSNGCTRGPASTRSPIGTPASRRPNCTARALFLMHDFNDKKQYPVATKTGSGNTRGKPDLVTSKLAALHFYELALVAPKPPEGSFDQAAAVRGKEIFGSNAQCATCHVSPLFTEPATTCTHRPRWASMLSKPTARPRTCITPRPSPGSGRT